MLPTKNLTRLTWLLLVFSLLIGLAAILLFIQNVDVVLPASWGSPEGARNNPTAWLNTIVQALLLPLLSGVFGMLIVNRLPRHPIGWMLSILGFTSAFAMLTNEWAVYAYYNAQIDGAGGLAAWVTNWLWVIVFGISLTILAIFPNGRFYASQWQWLIGIPMLLFVFALIIGAAIETPMSSAYQIPNPFVQTHPETLYSILFYFGVLMMPVVVVMIGLQLFVRFRSSKGRERQQMKWLLVGVSLFIVLVLTGLSLVILFDFQIAGVLVNVSVMAPLTGLGIAMIRHRLYDIDVIIRRTLVYATLSGVLILIYFGAVILLQYLFDILVGEHNSQLIVVVSTLLIAALFSPLRRRIQLTIDRRFYRQKYDAAQTLAGFASAARDEVDLEVLTAELVRVVEETVQPESVYVWMKDSGESKPSLRG